MKDQESTFSGRAGRRKCSVPRDGELSLKKLIILEALTKVRKATLSFVISVCLSVCTSAWNNSSPPGRISMKFGIWEVKVFWRSWIRASWYKCVNNNQDALYRIIHYSKSALHVSGDVFAHNQERLAVFTVSGIFLPKMLPAGVFDELKLRFNSWVNTSRYCKYSQVLLMIGENIARNM